MQNISYVAVGLFLEEKLERQIVGLSQKLYKDYNSWWCLSSELFPPHISLWLGYIPSKNEQALIQKLNNLMINYQNIKIELSEMHIEDNGKEYYLDQRVVKTTQLIDLHFKLLEELNEFREDYINPKYLSEDIQKDMSDIMKKNIMRYGTRFVGELFEPHVSISYVAKDKVDLDTLYKKLPNLSGMYESNQIIVFKQKESGKSIDILQNIIF